MSQNLNTELVNRVKVDRWWWRLLRLVRSLFEIFHNGTIISTLTKCPHSQNIIMEQRTVRLWLWGLLLCWTQQHLLPFSIHSPTLSKDSPNCFEPIMPSSNGKNKAKKKGTSCPREHGFSNFLVSVVHLRMMKWGLRQHLSLIYWVYLFILRKL